MTHPKPTFTPQLESEYRAYYLKEDINQFLLGIILWVVTIVGFGFSDFLLLGGSRVFFLLQALRVAYALFSAWMFNRLLHHTFKAHVFDRRVVTWGITTALLKIVINFLRPQDDGSAYLVDLMGVLSFYFFITARLSLRALPAALLTLADLVLLALPRVPTPALMVTTVTFCLTVANLIGLLFASRSSVNRRSAFVESKEEARVSAELQRLASTDPLTGVLNRRRLLERASDAYYRFRRYKRPFSILVMDLDGFKQVNDSLGHQQGDVVLIDFSKAVAAAKREADSLGRMGGDEFCLVLPETRPEDAAILAQRILDRCDEMTFSTGPDEIHVTASIGISQVGQDDANLDTLFARADAALYSAKHNGRNRWVIS